MSKNGKRNKGRRNVFLKDVHANIMKNMSLNNLSASCEAVDRDGESWEE